MKELIMKILELINDTDLKVGITIQTDNEEYFEIRKINKNEEQDYEEGENE